MTVTTAYAQYDISYTNRVPYITSDEYNNAPTAMDVSNLIPGGSAQANTTALIETIGRASSWVDQYTMGSYGTLVATKNTENARIWGNRLGQIIVHPRYWPILEVDSFSYGVTGFGFGTGNSASITPATNIWIEPQQFIVQPSGAFNFGLGAISSINAGIQYYCTWSYSNGYPTTTLSASVAASGASITPVSVTGIYPGTTLTLYDMPYDEQVQVASTYVPGGAVLPLTTGVQYSHLAGVMVTNLPPSVKQASILATTAFIKQRGSGAMVVADLGAAVKQSAGFSQGSGSDWAEAKCLLNPFRQMFVGT